MSDNFKTNFIITLLVAIFIHMSMWRTETADEYTLARELWRAAYPLYVISVCVLWAYWIGIKESQRKQKEDSQNATSNADRNA